MATQRKLGGYQNRKRERKKEEKYSLLKLKPANGFL